MSASRSWQHPREIEAGSRNGRKQERATAQCTKCREPYSGLSLMNSHEFVQASHYDQPMGTLRTSFCSALPLDMASVCPEVPRGTTGVRDETSSTTKGSLGRSVELHCAGTDGAFLSFVLPPSSVISGRSPDPTTYANGSAEGQTSASWSAGGCGGACKRRGEGRRREGTAESAYRASCRRRDALPHKPSSVSPGSESDLRCCFGAPALISEIFAEWVQAAMSACVLGSADEGEPEITPRSELLGKLPAIRVHMKTTTYSGWGAKKHQLVLRPVMSGTVRKCRQQECRVRCILPSVSGIGHAVFQLFQAAFRRPIGTGRHWPLPGLNASPLEPNGSHWFSTVTIRESPIAAGSHWIPVA
ncbi:hypothetical protein FB451DRAFT_1199567 [Mycena latifolia]|nr:hypothetical protein FB451DRAFT_1199567 [Mycena latifolia]